MHHNKNSQEYFDSSVVSDIRTENLREKFIPGGNPGDVSVTKVGRFAPRRPLPMHSNDRVILPLKDQGFEVLKRGAKQTLRLRRDMQGISRLSDIWRER